MIEQGLYDLLSSDQALSQLVGARIYPVLIPEETTYPAITYQGVTGSVKPSVDGRAYSEKSIQIDAWGNTYGDIKCVQAALHRILDGYVGTLSDGTRVLSSLRINEFDAYESDARVYRSITEYQFQFVEQS